MKKLAFLLIFLFIATLGYAGVAVVGELSREQNVKLGDKTEGIILVRNTGKETCEVKAYQTDYLFTCDGTNEYGKPGSNPRSNTPWITLNPVRVTVPPQETASIYYRILIPEDKNLHGTYWSLLMVESVVKPTPEEAAPGKKKISVGIQAIIRYGIQIVTNIEETGERKIKFLDKKLVEKEGRKFLQVDIENIGTRTLSPAVWLELYNSQGIYTGKFEGGKLRIYPTCSIRQEIELTDVPKGKYKGILVVDNGDEHVFGGQYDLEIK